MGKALPLSSLRRGRFHTPWWMLITPSLETRQALLSVTSAPFLTEPAQPKIKAETAEAETKAPVRPQFEPHDQANQPEATLPSIKDQRMHMGYTKAWRMELDSDIWSMPPMYQRVWHYLRQKANWQVKLMPTEKIPKMGMWVSAGMIVTSLEQIAEGVSYREHRAWRMPNKRTVQCILKWLEVYGMIYRESNARGTVIYIVNWNTYQSNENEKVTPKVTAKVTPKVTQVAPQSIRWVHTTKESKESKERITPCGSPENGEPSSVHNSEKPDTLPSNPTETAPQVPDARRQNPRKARSSKKPADFRVSEVIGYFSDVCQEIKGFKPTIAVGKDGKAVKDALKTMDQAEINVIIRFFLKSPKSKEVGVSLTAALSAHTVNLYRAAKTTQGDPGMGNLNAGRDPGL
jgi:hypothetical protein